MRLMLFYGLGDAGTGLAASQLGFYLFVFFTCTAGLDPFIAGSLLMLIKVWDGINDPLIGWLSDHTKTKWGPRLPWMVVSAVPLGLSLSAIWWVPEIGTLGIESNQKILYYAVIAIILMTAYTGVNLPYATLASEITKQTNIRTSLNASRFTGSILASLTGLFIAWELTKVGAEGYVKMGQVTGLIATVTTLICCWGLAPFAKNAQQPQNNSEPIGVQFRRISKNKKFLKVLGLYFLLWCGLQLMQTVALIYLVQVMRVPSTEATFGLIIFQISALLGLQFWKIYSNKFTRIKALHFGSCLWIIACIAAMVLPPLSKGDPINTLYLAPESYLLNLYPLIAVVILGGFGASTAYLMPWSLLPDAIDDDPEKPAGFYTAWMVLIQKIGMGLSMGFFGTLLKLADFKTPEDCTGALTFINQPQTADLAIRCSMGLIPALLVVLGLLIMSTWPEQKYKISENS